MPVLSKEGAATQIQARFRGNKGRQTAEAKQGRRQKGETLRLKKSGLFATNTVETSDSGSSKATYNSSRPEVHFSNTVSYLEPKEDIEIRKLAALGGLPERESAPEAAPLSAEEARAAAKAITISDDKDPFQVRNATNQALLRLLYLEVTAARQTEEKVKELEVKLAAEKKAKETALEAVEIAEEAIQFLANVFVNVQFKDQIQKPNDQIVDKKFEVANFLRVENIQPRGQDQQLEATRPFAEHQAFRERVEAANRESIPYANARVERIKFYLANASSQDQVEKLQDQLSSAKAALAKANATRQSAARSSDEGASEPPPKPKLISPNERRKVRNIKK